MFKEIIKKTLRVPMLYSNERNENTTDSSRSVIKLLDGLLISNGFKLSPELAYQLSLFDFDSGCCTQMSIDILSAVKELVGAHVEHNVYFKNFPNGVPDTMEFWAECIKDALADPKSAADIKLSISFGIINLLELPKYGKYLHTYKDMVAVHEAFIGNAGKNIKVLQLGERIEEERKKLFISLAGSRIPLSESDRELLGKLSSFGDIPGDMPMRENRAIVNANRIIYGLPIIIDTVTDVLRLACYLSDGDVTLAKPTRFKSFPRPQRRLICSALHIFAEQYPEKLADVKMYSEQWKRLFEKLHPEECKGYYNAMLVREVALGHSTVSTTASKIEKLLGAGDIKGALEIYKSHPGMLYRSADRLLRNWESRNLVLTAITDTVKEIPARVLLSVREHFMNRGTGDKRIFTNTKGKTWVTDDNRDLIFTDTQQKVLEIIDTELISRLSEKMDVIIDPAALSVALPKSNKGMEKGIGMMPRGSKMSVCDNGENLRFFMYWKEKSHRTDYDLSTLILHSDFGYAEQASYTNLTGQGFSHSGDITSAPEGASEFIEFDLNAVSGDYIIPQVNIYSGETFDEVEESFFGYMERNPEDLGLPYEPKTVKSKSDIRGVGKIALPLVFAKQNDGRWTVQWMQMYLKGRVIFNRIEGNKISTTLLAKAIIEHEYLYVSYLAKLLISKDVKVRYMSEIEVKLEEPVVYIGLTVPEGLPKGSKTYTLSNIHEVVELFS